ncbi:dihydroneopterin aldolase [Candidatus Latescibacterota bacterium]
MCEQYGDTIRLRGMKFMATHGVRPEEKTQTQPFEVDVEVKLDLSVPAVSDRIEDTLNYSHIIAEVEAVMNGAHHCLLERLAGLIIERLSTLVTAGEVTVRIRKPRAPVTISCDTIEVELSRKVGN